MEKVSLFLSIIAIIISIITIIVDNRRDYNIARTDLHAKICSDIFDAFLVKRIPTARKQIKFSLDGKLQGGDALCRELVSIVYDALFYQYDDENFYSALKKLCFDLQDDIVIAADKTYLEDSLQKEFFSNIQSKIEKIYLLIDKKRTGKKF